MRKIGKIIGFSLIGLIAVSIVGCSVLGKVLEYQNDHYYENLKTEKHLEKKYSVLGEFEISSKEYTSSNSQMKKVEVWYPADMETSNKTYPVVVIANGTGTPASKYKAFFRHLASWGFIAIGNEDENSRTGESSNLTLDYLFTLNNDSSSVFYNKVDIENIGIGGHSQGGVGAINALNNQSYGDKYKAIYTASCTSPHHSDNLGEGWSYDVTKINIPYFQIAGNIGWDAGSATSADSSEAQGICPLYVMNEHYANSPSLNKVMGRLDNVDHGATYQKADAYMTAWFRYWLQDDQEAKSVFFGDDAEILTNSNWKDIQKSI